MNWNAIMGLISTIALFLPVLLILLLRLGAHRTFPALLCYYSIVGAYNLLTEGYFKVSHDTVHYWSICNNLLDAPLMMFFLTYFSPTQSFTRKMRFVIIGLVIFETVVVLIKGFNTEAITITLGPALLTVFFFCGIFFVRLTKIAIMRHKGAGKAMMAASLLFAYGCYTIIYLMYYVFKTPYVSDTFLIYFLVATFSSLLMCTGILLEKRRVLKLNELLQTRKELNDLYREEPKKVTPLRTAMLDFDKDQWV